MAVYEDREHFIPLRKSDVIELLCRQPEMASDQRDDFRQFCKLVVATFHFEYHEKLEELKDAYAPFDPDADTKLLKEYTPDQKQEREEAVFKDLAWLMERANFKQLGQEDIDKALEGTSEGGVNMDVDLKVFQEGRWKIFARGDTTQTVRTRKWWKLWRLEEKQEEIWKRLVMVFKLQPHKRLGRKIDFDKIYVRVYKDIPKMDLETLIPGATPQMGWVDKSKIGVPVATGVAGLLWKVIVFVLFLYGLYQLDPKGFPEDFATAPPEQKAWIYFTTGAFLLGVMMLGSYAFKSYSSYQNLKNRYEKNLSQALFYQTLDGNAGVLFRLLDEAEEQECREAILGYWFLWRFAGRDGWTAERLDDTIEEFLDKKAGVQVDFEIEDALAKLERLRVVEKLTPPAGARKADVVGSQLAGNLAVEPVVRYRAQPLDKALEMLDWAWDNYFKYNNPEPEEPPVAARPPKK